MSDRLWTLYKQLAGPISKRGLGSRFPVLKTLHERIVRRLHTNIAVAAGHKLLLPARDASALSTSLSFYGEYEALETRVVEETVRPDDVAIDIGANIGYFTLLCARRVGSGGRVYSFEPEPDNFDLLTRNVALNKYSNVTLEKKAVSDRAGDARFYLSASNPGMHALHPQASPGVEIQVETITLDDYFSARDRRVDVIKMDIEGAELGALRGMEGLLHDNRRISLLTEFVPAHLRAAGSDPSDVLDFLTDRGFTIMNLDAARQRIEPADRARLLDPSTHTNLFCTRS
jgi:FkbM family methyltransferase